MNTVKTCNACGCKFLSVSWIPARVTGYCSEHCIGPRQASLTQQQYAIKQSVLTSVANQQLDLMAERRIEADE